MTATIRSAAIGDEEWLAELNRVVQDVHLARRPEHFTPTQLPEATEWYRAKLATPHARIWIAEEGSRPVGYVLALYQSAPATPFTQARQWCEIDQIAVDAMYRRQGIARARIR